MRHGVSMVKILLMSLYMDLANVKTKLSVLGDAHANIEQELE